jgi:cytochrome c peroxidase
LGLLKPLFFSLSPEHTMSIFRRPDYQSDTTQFINQLKTQRPELDAQQQEGRALLWDKRLSRDEQQAFRAGRVAQKPYVYQTEA